MRNAYIRAIIGGDMEMEYDYDYNCCENPHRHCRCAYSMEPCRKCEWESEHELWHQENDEEE